MLDPGTVLQNRYEIERLLASGGMGAVYLAKDRRLGSTIALKETFYGDDDRLLKAFEREARLLANLRHAALPKVMDHFAEGKGQFLVMEFIPGEDLMEMLERRGSAFSPEEVLGWADQLLGALEYLHRQEPPIIHRDIKPHNLKLTGDGQIVLLDFGLAKGAAWQMSRVTTGSSILGYTPSYAPLEQMRGTGTDARSDLYSLGATLYHLMTGETPADALARVEAVADGQSDPLRPANELNSEVTPDVAEVLIQAMALNRDRRPASAAEMRRMLGDGRRSSVPVSDSNIKTVVTPSSVEVSPERRTVQQEDAETLRLADRPLVIPEGEKGPDVKQIIVPLPPDTELTVKRSPLPTAPDALIKREGKRRGIPIAIGSAVVLAIVIVIAIIASSWSSTSEPSGPEPPTVSGIATKSFEFETVTVNANGNVTERRKGQARYISEDLGGGVTLEMVEIPAGTFLMGSPDNEADRSSDEGPQHRVTVPSFYMGKYEVTQTQWRAVARLPKVNRDLKAKPSRFEGDDLPVESVFREDAIEFCARLSNKTGKTYRLPSEAEWEYACRAGTTTPFAFGETITPEMVNYDGNYPYGSAPKGEYREMTVPVGSLAVANAFGLYDMHGNVWEWCADPWHGDYVGAPSDGGIWEANSDEFFKVLRGGSWLLNSNYCRSACRIPSPPDNQFILGLRVVLDVRTQ